MIFDAISFIEVSIFITYLIGLGFGYIFLFLFTPKSNRKEFFKSPNYLRHLLLAGLPLTILLSVSFTALINSQFSSIYNGSSSYIFALFLTSICFISSLLFFGILKVDLSELKSIDKFSGFFKILKFHLQPFQYFIFNWLLLNAISITIFVFPYPVTIISTSIGIYTCFLTTAIFSVSNSN